MTPTAHRSKVANSVQNARQDTAAYDVDRSTSRVVVVCAITPPDYSGAGLSALRIAERLHRDGRLAFVLTRTLAEGNGHRMFQVREGLPAVPEEHIARVRAERRTGEGELSLLREALQFAVDSLALAASTIWQLIRRRRTYEIVHCFSPSWLSFYTIVFGKLLGKHVVLEATLIGRDEPQARPPRDLFGMKNAARKLQYFLADRIVVLSPALATRLSAAGYSQRIHMIGRAVDSGRFRPVHDQERRRLRCELGLRNEGPILLFVGAIGERKGAALLPLVLARVVEKHPTATLVIVGQIGATQQAKEIYARMLADIERHGLSERVRFAARTGTIERYMKAATLFLFPSRREGFANVLVEAMACGLIPVALSIPGITDHIITQGEDGVYVEEDDPDAFTRAILHLLEDPARRERMAVAAVRGVRERFSTAAVDAAYAAMYAQLEHRRGAHDR